MTTFPSEASRGVSGGPVRFTRDIAKCGHVINVFSRVCHSCHFAGWWPPSPVLRSPPLTWDQAAAEADLEAVIEEWTQVGRWPYER